MSKVWAFASVVAPALVGTLLSQTVGWYADLTTDTSAVPAAAAPQAEPGRHSVELLSVEPTQLLQVTAPTATANFSAERSLRAVQSARHRGRTYLAVLSAAPGATADSVSVWSSADEQQWQQEWEQQISGQAFAPQVLAFDAQLFVYFSSASGFGQEEQTQAIGLNAEGQWQPAQQLQLAGQIVSAVRVVDGVALMTTHTGGSQLYRYTDEAREVRLLTTNDGLNWHLPSAGQQAVYRGGGSDAAFSSSDDGNLLALVRKEAGDESGWGSSVCLAVANGWTHWDCVNDPKNYGAATLFSYDGETYLIGQRKLSDDGRYDLGEGSGLVRTARNQVAELSSGRRCSLWRFSAAERRLAFVSDLPSQGDTCAASVLPGKVPGQFVIYNPSSDLSGPDLAVRPAQQQPNRLYRYVIALSRQRATHTVAY